MNKLLHFAESVICFEEGYREKPYYCSEGYPTIGFGKKIGEKGEDLPVITISKEEAFADLRKILNQSVNDLSKNKSTKAAWDALVDDDHRKAILVSMCYQLGMKRLSGFVETLKHIADKNYIKASEEMLKSKAAIQTPKRWKRQASAFKSGDLISVYKIQ